jgi:hypothetical protein
MRNKPASASSQPSFSVRPTPCLGIDDIEMQTNRVEAATLGSKQQGVHMADHARVWGLLRMRLSEVPAAQRREWDKGALRIWWEECLESPDFEPFNRLDFETVADYCKGLYGIRVMH